LIQQRQKALLIYDEDVMLNGMEVKRFGMSFFTDDQINDVKKKLKEYFKHGVRVGYLFD
jgi:hypothetical protein